MSKVLERCGAQSGRLNGLAESQKNLLSNAGNSWDSPLELPERYLRSDAAVQFTENLKDTLKQQEPNKCGLACVHGMERVLPLWQLALGEQDLLIQHLLVVRHPLAVVEQFHNNEGWNRDHALLVWLQSTLAMEKHSRNCSRVIIDGEQLAWDLDGTLNQIEATLHLTLPERNHKNLIELEDDSEQQYVLTSNKTISRMPSRSAGSLLLSMALQLHEWLLAEHQERERQRHLPETIRDQLKLAEGLMGRTLNDIYLQNKSLKSKMGRLEMRKSLRISNWIRSHIRKAA